MRKRAWLLICILFIILYGIGCWDVQDIRNRAFVTAIGIDLAQGPQAPQYKITFEIVRPVGLKGGAEGPASIIQTVKADSINTAIEQLEARVTRPVFLTHLALIIIGEEKGRDGFKDIADYFSRHQDVQKRLRVMFVQQGEAADIFKAEPQFEPYLSVDLVRQTLLQPEHSITRTNPFIELLLDLHSTGGKALGSRIIKPEEGSTAIRHGAAVFDQWKLVGWLSSKETQGANWVLEDIDIKIKRKKDENLYTYFVNKKSARIVPEILNEEIHFTVKIQSDGTILQQQGEQLDLSKPENIAQLEKLFSQTIKQQVQGAVVKAQKEFGVDYLKFGAALKRKDPKFFDTVNWDEVFPTVPVTVEVHSEITRTGLSP
jgi:spore germination protein KC